MNNFLQQILEKWSSLSTTKKSAAIIMGVAVIISVTMLSRWANQSNFKPLFTNLESKDASAVVEQLKELGVEYQLGAQGTSVLVPEDKVYELRLQLAGTGIVPSGGTGFELFDQTRLGMTDFERRLNYQRALQEELRRTIVAMEEVEQARVHLVIPESSVFIDNAPEASASVVIKLHPMASLGPNQVRGIVMLLTNSVENLRPENVNVIDMEGNVLSDQIGSNDNSSLAQNRVRQQGLQREFEKNLEDRVQRMLERIFGPGKVVTMISADLNFDERQVTRIDYGQDGVVKSEQIIRENTSTNSSSAGGAVGTDSNMNTYPGLDQAGESNSQSSENITRQYEIDQEQETVVFAPGRVERLSTAVTVDGPLTDQQVAQIQDLVTAAIGYYPDRGDQLTVMSMAFDKSFVTEAEKAMEQQAAQQFQEQLMQRYIYAGLTALGLILVFILILIGFRRRRASGQLDATIEDLVPVQDVSSMHIEEEEIQTHEDPKKRVEREKREKKKKDVRRLVDENPENAAQLVKTWLSEK